MNFLLLFLVAILVTSIIIITVSSNKKKEEPPLKTCNGYLYNNLCEENCGDKYFDDSKKICYNTIPEGMFADGKRLVSSCDTNKYIDGNECVSNCDTRLINKVIEGKNCIENCTKYLDLIGYNKLECKDGCGDYYIIDNKFKRFGTHSNYCISPSYAVNYINMKNLFINNQGKFILDIIDLPQEKIFLQGTNENKTLLPLTLSNRDFNLFKKLLVSPSGNTYGEAYSDRINIYKVDIFNTDRYYSTNPAISLFPNSLVGTSIDIEDCIMYDDSNYLLLLKKSFTDRTNYIFYHVYINENVAVAKIIYEYEILNNTTFKFYHAVYNKLDNTYKICYVITEPGTIKTQVISYDINVTPNIITSPFSILNKEDIPLEQLDTTTYELLDLKILAFPQVILYYLNDKTITNPNVRTLRAKSYLNPNILDDEEYIGIIKSNPTFTVSEKRAYYSGYNNSTKIVFINQVDINDNVIVFKTIETFGPYETDPEVTLKTDLNGNYLLCSITENDNNDNPTRKELHKINLITEKSELLISS